eukprot:4482935-Pyramimonas_sp.AAC.1
MRGLASDPRGPAPSCSTQTLFSTSPPTPLHAPLYPPPAGPAHRTLHMCHTPAPPRPSDVTHVSHTRPPSPSDVTHVSHTRPTSPVG